MGAFLSIAFIILIAVFIVISADRVISFLFPYLSTPSFDEEEPKDYKKDDEDEAINKDITKRLISYTKRMERKRFISKKYRRNR